MPKNLLYKLLDLPGITISLVAHKYYPSDYCLLNRKINELAAADCESEYKYFHYVIELLISGEDHRFNYHPGFDIIAIARALKRRILSKKREGASTIDQQLVRVITGDFRKSLGRKMKEIALATTLRTLTDRKYIPLFYLKVAYYGTGMDGIENYLRVKKQTQKPITLEMAAEIVARIKYPEPAQFVGSKQVKISRRVDHLLALHYKHSNRIFLKYY